jgi:hypothetical protein
MPLTTKLSKKILFTDYDLEADTIGKFKSTEISILYKYSAVK